ncbi:MAG: segregation/condensation protein A [Candidatus Niyogibacteria bacterium]|nr:segregation/condensation protein A [Candidatus Niyogibacteria bacterium]
MSGHYSVKTEAFEGPMDALLRLIEESKLSVNEVSLADVSEQYIAYVRALPELPRHEAASFLVIASTLVLIKSKSLLPNLELTEEEKESIDDLERRLKLYQRLKELAKNIEALEGRGMIYEREAFSGVALGFVEPRGVDVGVLQRTMAAFLKVLPIKEELPEKLVKSVVKIEDKIAEIFERVQKAMRSSFKDFVGTGDRTTIVVSFLALLELVKDGLIVVSQEGQYKDIEITRN